MDSTILGKTLALALAIFAVGTLLCLPMYKFKLRRFVRSQLFIKICLWIPIFVVFLSVLYTGNIIRSVIFGIIYLFCLREFIRNFMKKYSFTLLIYLLVFSLAFAHFIFFGLRFDNQLYTVFFIAICFASVLSDVCAFFLGNYFGRHKLPQFINSSKSWEGVFGQIIGAALGVLLTRSIISDDISLWLIVPVGFGSAAGDLLNSYIKRMLSIKDWSQALPGHGGYLDRLSSLVFAVTLSFYTLFLIN